MPACKSCTDFQHLKAVVSIACWSLPHTASEFRLFLTVVRRRGRQARGTKERYPPLRCASSLSCRPRCVTRKLSRAARGNATRDSHATGARVPTRWHPREQRDATTACLSASPAAASSPLHAVRCRCLFFFSTPTLAFRREL